MTKALHLVVLLNGFTFLFDENKAYTIENSGIPTTSVNAMKPAIGCDVVIPFQSKPKKSRGMLLKPKTNDINTMKTINRAKSKGIPIRQPKHPKPNFKEDSKQPLFVVGALPETVFPIFSSVTASPRISSF